MAKAKLRACPFCGSNRVCPVWYPFHDPPSALVRYDNCQARGPIMKTTAAAIQRWNRHVPRKSTYPANVELPKLWLRRAK